MVKDFEILHILSEDVDKAFEAFYTQLLEEEHFSIYFDSKEQINMLIQKQKENFVNCLSLPTRQVKANYIRLGEMHYDLRLPYVDFMKGMEILEDHFLIYVQTKEQSVSLMNAIFDYFKLIKSSTARGYLNKMLQEDKNDLKVFFEDLKSQNDIDNTIVLDRMNWLKTLLDAVEKGDQKQELLDSEGFHKWLNKLEFLSLEKRKFLEDLDKRIDINTRNLFYFLKKEDYLEILPLYSSLMNVYKLTMLLSSSVSLEMSDYVISNLRKDGMTNLMRKEAFEQFLTQEIATTKRYEMPFCLVFIDLDDFKNVNDTYGHFSGDEVIKHVGKTICENVRSSDIGFRIGGDEFAIILKGATAKQAQNVCSVIINDIAKKEFFIKEDEKFQVTVSCGIYECNCSNLQTMDYKDVINAVDKNLYRAKELGKNRIIR